MSPRSRTIRLSVGLFALACCCLVHPSQATTFPRPDPIKEDAGMARWLAHLNSYGTLSVLKDGKPFGGIASYSDGALMSSTGRLFFYLAAMGTLPQNTAKNPQVSFTVTEAQLPGGCPEPEEPTCAKVTFMGKFLPAAGKDQELARNSIYSRHPKMASWSTVSDHDFTLYELQIEEIHLLDFFGGMKHVEAADYFNAKLKQAASEDSVTQNSVEQGSAGSSGITMSSIWVGAVVGSLAGSLVGVALVAVGYKLYADRRQEKPYSLADNQ